ncbi:DNA adenine methylase [Burkholderia ambifaria]|uniref:DNA adenine methylase n=1 Tax=Burkholderia ambifaria TaxID=152480 RepID=UPI001BA32F0B|nr:DNA adenine methylase [Burkholderia ambifaria]MBR8179303.1 DNA adenine methylase [Burkholderia ambifaria]
MEKYLGNKASLLPLIERFFTERIPEAGRLSDVFAGTNNVSRYFRARGWSTAACDANRFSYVLAQAYLGTSAPPQFQAVRSVRSDLSRLRDMQSELARSIGRYGALYLPDIAAEQLFQDLKHLANVLVRLQGIGEKNQRPGVITEYFTQWGGRSSYTSIRGTQGLRNYFSRHNALFLDGVLKTIREWWREGNLTRNELFLLMTSVLEEVVITANVNGTFHDFNRDRLWPNAEQAFQLRIPLVLCSGPSAEIANADSIHAAQSFAQHDICYLDPPYNFRQYSAYYHLLNFISAYPFLNDIEAYVDGLKHVRGQHPEDDFTSDFCFRTRFVDSLRKLIEAVEADHVVLSYYGGRNHWNHWAAVDEPTDEGLRELVSLFQDSQLFTSCEVVPALDIRKNYQSRGGEQKELVNEYLFHGVKRDRQMNRCPASPSPLSANLRWGLVDDFGHTLPLAENDVDPVLLVAS